MPLIEQLQEKIKNLELQLDSQSSEKTESQAKSRTEGARLTKSAGKEISEDEGRIGGPFEKNPNPEFINNRIEVFERLYKKKQDEIASKEKEPIKVTLPDGNVIEGKAWETSPMDVAVGISKGLANSVYVAKVRYTRRLGEKQQITSGMDELDEVEELGFDKGELWDLTRPLEGDCLLELLKFDEPEAKMVFWHSSAHVLGECLECTFGSHLTVGPPVDPGFYYDAYMGDNGIEAADLKTLEAKAKKIVKEKQEFQRLVLTKEEALEMFKDNPYKVSIIKNKVKDGSLTSCYRNGPLIDLCLGPHIPNTGKIKAMELKQATTAYWLGSDKNDSLQRVQGISFPDKKLMSEHKKMVKLAEENDHRKKGLEQDLFFFHPLSPGCGFWTPHGARIFNTLLAYIRAEYVKRGYSEVVTPNIFNSDLWKTSGHWEHYRDDMFTFTDGEEEGQTFALKPMNCPGHCLIFGNRVRSYRDLPMRLADFGVLHRNEASGALTGLTRVRRFQQDDAHIFCRQDQVKSEVLGALNFMKSVYDTFGMTFKLERSTRPKKACGLVDDEGNPDPEGIALWDQAEAALADALDEFIGKGNWRDNPGDGAFYGPKIDIKVFDALRRKHQCATVQLDFQLPIRFKLRYTAKAKDGEGDNFERPVIIHRAMLGSIERFTAILTEHYGGKWPFWISPRQAMIVPVAAAFNAYGESLRERLHLLGFAVALDDSSKTLNKKLLLARKEQYNFVLIVGETEEQNNSVNIRTRKNTRVGEVSVEDLIERFNKYRDEKLADDIVDPDQDDSDAKAAFKAKQEAKKAELKAKQKAAAEEKRKKREEERRARELQKEEAQN